MLVIYFPFKEMLGKAVLIVWEREWVRDDISLILITSGSPAPKQLGFCSPRPQAALRPGTAFHPTLCTPLTLLGRLAKCLIAHCFHRLLGVLVFSVSDMLMCPPQTEYSQQAGTESGLPLHTVSPRDGKGDGCNSDFFPFVCWN